MRRARLAVTGIFSLAAQDRPCRIRRTQWFLCFARGVAAGFGLALLSATASAAEIGTAFTYQGVLENPPGNPLNDTCAFEFALCDDAVAACSPGTVSSHPAVAVTDGLFTVPDVDFGDDACNGEARWMAISVMCSGDAGFVSLSPRVELKPAPYALRAVEGVGPPSGIHVTPDGDVGIGTTTPAAQLDVNGAARATTVEITGGAPVVPSLVAWGNNDYGQINVPSDTFTSVAGGDYHSLAIRTDGTLAGWGRNDFGQTNVPAGTFVAVAAGLNHSVAIRSDGTLLAWGDNQYGQTDVPSGTFIAVDARWLHSLAIRSDGTLVAWGNNTNFPSVPSGTFVAIANGSIHSLAIRTDGTLAGWGNNGNGEINVPEGTFIAVAAGSGYSLATRTDGTLVGWGDNFLGAINVPTGAFAAVAAGESHSLAIRSDGTLIGWGRSDLGQIDVPPGMFTALSAGLHHSMAIRSNPPVPDPALRLYADSAVKPGSNTWTIFSDRRLKKNITPLSGALDHLLQLRGVTFNWMDPASQGGITGTQMGLIADEVQRVFPQWVGRDPRGYQTLTVGGFEALTAEAMRELREEKDCEIQDLKSQISDLKEMVKELQKGNAATKCGK